MKLFFIYMLTIIALQVQAQQKNNRVNIPLMAGNEYLIEVILLSEGVTYSSKNVTVIYDKQFFNTIQTELEYRVSVPAVQKILKKLKMKVKIYAQNGHLIIFNESINVSMKRFVTRQYGGLYKFFMEHRQMLHYGHTVEAIPDKLTIKMEYLYEEKIKIQEKKRQLLDKLYKKSMNSSQNISLPRIIINNHIITKNIQFTSISDIVTYGSHQIVIGFQLIQLFACLQAFDALNDQILHLFIEVIDFIKQKPKRIPKKSYESAEDFLSIIQIANDLLDYELNYSSEERYDQVMKFLNTTISKKSSEQIVPKGTSFFINFNFQELMSDLSYAFFLFYLVVQSVGTVIRFIMQFWMWDSIKKRKRGITIARPIYRVAFEGIQNINLWIFLHYNLVNILLTCFYVTCYNMWKVRKLIKGVQFKIQFPFFEVQPKQHYKSYFYQDLKAVWTCFYSIFIISLFSFFFQNAFYSTSNHSIPRISLHIMNRLIYIFSTYFGVIIWFPQIYVNFKVKSVEHMNWALVVIYFLMAISDNYCLFQNHSFFYIIFAIKEECVLLVLFYQSSMYGDSPNELQKNYQQKVAQQLQEKQQVEANAHIKNE